MNQVEWEILLSVRDKLAAAPHGTKGAMVADACRLLQCDSKTVYRKLAEVGLVTARKARSDKGDTVYTRENLMLISGMLIESTRRNGKQLLTVEDVIDIAHSNGQLPSKLTAGRVAQLLREHKLHPDQLNAQTPATELRSLHPNHCWQIDASVCVLYYIKGGHLQSMPREEFYKNKPQNLAKVVNDLCIRYACTDHTTGTLWARYYTGGETSENLIEFFMWCVTQREGCPAHGVPWIVMLDPGAANKSYMFKNLCTRLKVHLQINAVGNARGKGQVEQAHNLIERHFEGRLYFMPELDLGSLNVLCERWQVAFNATRKHSRHGHARYSAWMRITPEQLRIAPSLDLMRDLVTTVEETRRVSNNMTVSYVVKGYGSNDYRVAYVPGVMVGQKVTICVNPYRAPAIDVQYADPETGEMAWICVEPVERSDESFMFDAAAPVIGESYKAQPHTVADRNRTAIAFEAHNVTSLDDVDKARKVHAQVYQGRIDAMADVDATPVPAYLPRRGTDMDAEVRAVISAPITILEACTRIKAMAGDAYDPKTYGWLEERFPDGSVPADQVEALAAQLGHGNPREEHEFPRAPDAAPPLLRVVGGAR